MISLGIECSAYVFGVGIVNDKKKILADRRFFFKPEKGGLIPRMASEEHAKNSKKIIEKSLEEAGLSLNDIGVVCFTQGMGIPNNLRICSSVARYIALKYKKPIVGVNHAIGHIEIGKMLTKCEDPVILYLSGGNTQIIAYSEGKYRIFGETEDIPVGNAFDVLARNMGLDMPGGPKIEELAKKGKYIEIPYVVKGMDVSFSGILTDCIRKLKKGIKSENVAYSFQETVFSMLVEVTERAMAQTGKNEVLAVGGVAANKRLREMLNIMCRERGAKAYIAPHKYSGDNGVMIAWAGLLEYTHRKKSIPINKTRIKPKWRIEDVDVCWI